MRHISHHKERKGEVVGDRFRLQLRNITNTIIRLCQVAYQEQYNPKEHVLIHIISQFESTTQYHANNQRKHRTWRYNWDMILPSPPLLPVVLPLNSYDLSQVITLSFVVNFTTQAILASHQIITQPFYYIDFLNHSF